MRLSLLERIERLERALIYVRNGTSGGTREGQVALEELREEVEHGNGNPDRTQEE